MCWGGEKAASSFSLLASSLIVPDQCLSFPRLVCWGTEKFLFDYGGEVAQELAFFFIEWPGLVVNEAERSHLEVVHAQRTACIKADLWLTFHRGVI
jgi:hypothetical protein